MVDKQVDVSKFADFEADVAPQQAQSQDQKEPKEQSTEQPRDQGQQGSSLVSSIPSGDRIIASPLAKSLAREKGIDLTHVTGTGPNNRIIKADVLEFTRR